MKKVVLLLAATLLLGVAVQPVLASCPPNDVCANIPLGATAEEIAAGVGQEWNIPDYACGQTGANVEITAEAGTRSLDFSVDGGAGVNIPHILEFDVEIPLEPGDPPFTIVASLDGNETTMRDGFNDLGEINIFLETGGPNLPLLSPRRTILLVAGLLAAGVAILVFRRAT